MTYLVWDESSKKAALIDPVFDFTERYLSILEERDLTLTYAMATHTHADHITACFTLKEKLGCEYLMWHSTSCLGVTRYVNDGDVV
jgi:glyoxylase-like metal-dependent hydrolase (beta-lactamase superfamily II)